MRILQASLAYFGFVFSAGFVQGAVRVLWIVPRIGTRRAELLEAPFMLIVLTFAARWVNKRWLRQTSALGRLGTGVLALAFLIAAEVTTVVLRGLSLPKYLADRDQVSGAVYYLSLLIFALMPLWTGRRSRASEI